MGIVSGDYQYMGGFGSFGTTQGDMVLGKQVLEMYHKAMGRYTAYKSTIDSQLNQWSKNNPKVRDVIIDGIGFQARVSELDLDQLNDAMRAYSSELRGVVPMTYQGIGYAMGKRAANPTLWETIAGVSKMTAKDIASGAQKIGDDVIGSYKMLKYIAPVAVVVVLAGLFYRAKGGSLPIPSFSNLKSSLSKKLSSNPRRRKNKSKRRKK